MVSKIQLSVDNAFQKATFLDEAAIAKVPQFHRSELELGRLLGSGGFSHAFEIQSIHLSKDGLSKKEDESDGPLRGNDTNEHYTNNNDDEKNKSNNKDSPLQKTQQQRKREELTEWTAKKIKGRPPFVMKHIKPQFVRNCCECTGFGTTTTTTATNAAMKHDYDCPQGNNNNDNNNTAARKLKNAVAGLVKEAYFLACLRHPHILSLKGWAHEGLAGYTQPPHFDRFFLVLERMEGNLTERIKEWRQQLKRYKHLLLSATTTATTHALLYKGRLEVIRDVASALSFLHSRGVIHRDVKPSNIGFDVYGRVKLFDFGLAVELERAKTRTTTNTKSTTKLSSSPYYEHRRKHTTTTIPTVTTATASLSPPTYIPITGRVGTTKYMSPEVCRGLSYDHKADVYSLSLVLWEVMALQKPYRTITKANHRACVIETMERPPLPRDGIWPRGVVQLLQAAWQETPHLRPHMAELYDLLQREIAEFKRLRQHCLSNLQTSKNNSSSSSTTTTEGNHGRLGATTNGNNSIATTTTRSSSLAASAFQRIMVKSESVASVTTTDTTASGGTIHSPRQTRSSSPLSPPTTPTVGKEDALSTPIGMASP